MLSEPGDMPATSNQAVRPSAADSKEFTKPLDRAIPDREKPLTGSLNVTVIRGETKDANEEASLTSPITVGFVPSRLRVKLVLVSRTLPAKSRTFAKEILNSPSARTDDSDIEYLVPEFIVEIVTTDPKGAPVTFAGSKDVTGLEKVTNMSALVEPLNTGYGVESSVKVGRVRSR